MSDLMIGNDLLFLITHRAVFLLLAAYCHDLKRFKQIRLCDKLTAFLDRVDRRLVDHVRKVRSDQSRRRKRKRIQIHVIRHQHILGMYL